MPQQVAESEGEVRELQGQTVQFAERVVRLQTMVQVTIHARTLHYPQVPPPLLAAGGSGSALAF